MAHQDSIAPAALEDDQDRFKDDGRRVASKGQCARRHLVGTAPKENRSVRVSKSLPRACSGDMYATVPTVDQGW